MTTSRYRIRRLLPVVLGVIIAVSVCIQPVTAHAWDPFGIASIGLGAILDGVLGILVTVNSLLAQLFDAVGNSLKWVLSLEITTQLTVVGIAWTAIRDLVNLVFIVAFIGISFATIFGALGFFKGWHYRTALMPLIVAALLINFSLAIGKTIALVSNQASKVVLKTLGDPGAILLQNLQPNTLAMGSQMMRASAALNASLADSIKTYKNAESLRFGTCLLEEKIVAGAGTTKTRKTVVDCNMEIIAKRYLLTTAEATLLKNTSQVRLAAESIPSLPIDDKVALIGTAIFNSLMVVLLISCLGSAFIFLAFRIIVVWILLAISPIAWISYAIPGNKEGWHSWWKHMIAWNAFGPLYLLTLIPGLVMLGGSAEMMAQLKAAGGDIGTAGILIQQFFFYAFAVMIFVGGLALALKSSFATTVKGTAVVGGWAAKLGVFDEKGLAPLRFIGRKTGISAYGEATAERAKQIGGDITAAARGRFPALLRTEEEAKQLARARLGIRGADKDYDKTIATRVKAERERVEDTLKQQVQAAENRLAQAQTPEERIQLKEELKNLKNQQAVQLKGLLRSGNRNTALAAAEVLMEDDKLTAEELRDVGKQYTQISPAAMSEFVKRRNTNLIKNAPKHKFKNASELESFMTLIGDPKDAKKYYDAAKGGKNKIIGPLEAGANMKIEEKPNGRSYSFNELALKEAPKFKDEDWVAAEESFAQRAKAANDANPSGTPISSLDAMKEVGDNFHDRFKRRFLNARQQENMRIAAGTGEQAMRLQKISDDLANNTLEVKRLRDAIKEEKETAEAVEKELTESEEKKEKEKEEKPPKEEGPKKTT